MPSRPGAQAPGPRAIHAPGRPRAPGPAAPVRLRRVPGNEGRSVI